MSDPSKATDPRRAATFVALALFAGLSLLLVFSPAGRAAAAECRGGILYDTVDGKETAVGRCTQGETTASTSNSLLRDGVFGCNASKYANVGSTVAIGGVYVPVNDAAVTLNTGYLVYKECVLDGVVSKISEGARAELAKSVVNAINTGRGGAAQYVQNEQDELKQRAYKIIYNGLSDANIGVLCPAIKSPVRVAQARAAMAAYNASNKRLACSFSGSATEYDAAKSGTFSTWENLLALGRPENNPWLSFEYTREQIMSAVAADEQNQRERWLRNNGFYDVTEGGDDPLAEKIITPGFLVAQGANQIVSSGFRSLENAKEIDQITSALFSGLTTQLLTDTRGLTGITQRVGNQASYIDRMATESSAAVREGAINAALNILKTTRQIEAAFKGSKEKSAGSLSSAIVRLRGAENKCWDLLIPAVKEYAAANGGGTLKIATSTQYSQAAINAQIAPLATVIANDIKTSASALSIIDQLIASVVNSSSATNQRAALERLDTLVASGQLHTSADAQAASKQSDDVATAVASFVEDTLKAWGDSTDPTVGWCNINNPATIQMWHGKWK